MSDDSTTPHGFSEGCVLVIRARESGDWQPVMQWLAQHPEQAETVARFMGGANEIEQAANTLLASPDLAGTTVGGFVLREEIGRGAMGVVHRAFDPILNRDVAVKLVRGGEALTPTELVRFRFEAEAAGSLDHPNIVAVYTSGEAGGVPYLVMPLMACSLAARLKKLGPFTPTEAAKVVRDIALGVHHAHQRGLIHRDLKPGNILFDAAGVPHVADFGLAHRIDVTLSRDGIAGTVAYMAPEQARGERRLTVHADVHALGVILFELLTGRMPFGGGSVPEVIQRVIDDPAPAVGTLRPDVPRDLQTICARCLMKAPRERYASAQALADDLTKYLNGDPIDNHRGWVWDTVSRALGWQRETRAMGSWRVAFWGAASSILAMAVMQVAILTGAPLWVSQAAIAYYLLAWLGLMWGFLVARRDSLNPVERASTAFHFGAKFACTAVLPVQLWLHNGDPLYALPSFLAIVGLAVFAHGVTYWGRFYLVGLGQMLTAAAMPLIPATYWPSVYGLLLGVLQLWGGFHLRRVHAAAEAARLTNPDSATD